MPVGTKKHYESELNVGGAMVNATIIPGTTTQLDDIPADGPSLIVVSPQINKKINVTGFTGGVDG